MSRFERAANREELQERLSGADELAALDRAFHAMAQALGKAEGETRRLNAELEQRVAERTQQFQAANESLRESEARLHAIIDNMSQGVIFSDLDGQLFHWNRAALHLHGFASLDDCRLRLPEFQRFFELSRLDGRILPIERWPLARVLRGERLSGYDVRVRRLDQGWTRVFSYGGVLVQDVTGRQVAFLTILDITERVRAEEQIHRLARQVELLLKSAGEGILGLDLEGCTTFVNPAAEAMLGWQSHELLATPQHARIHHTRPDGTLYPHEDCPIYRAFKEGKVFHSENDVFWRKDGSSFPVSYTSTPVFEDGRITGAVVVFRDITERKQAEQRILQMNAELEQRVAERTQQLETLNRSLLSAKNQAEQANRAKSEFLSRMSHELRTPLNSILGFGQRMLKSDLPERDLKRVAQIVKGGQHLLDLVNEILDLARIEAGRMSVSLEPLSVVTAFSDAADLIGPLARQNEIDLRVEPVPTDHYVLADKQRLRQVLLNLLSNAIKYNRQRGSVTVACLGIGTAQLRLAVSDTGAGIPEAKLPQLFEPFHRLGAEHSAIEGTGLGLALSRGLVELMGGRISVESRSGVGTTVFVDLPRAAAPEARRAAPAPVHFPAPEVSSHTLLYIEDNLANITLVEDILSDRPGIRLMTAMQGGLGLDLARQHRPDLILLDVHLPDMMGDEFLRRLMADPALQTIPVVVLSADATRRQTDTLQSLGAREYLTKPLDEVRFLSVLDAILYVGGSVDGSYQV